MFLSYPLTSPHRRLKFIFSKIHMKYVVFMSLWPSTIKILISNWPRTRKFSQFFLKKQAGKTFFLPWSRIRSRSTSNFYALIGQI